ncbi:MAG TPA: indolepyruvate ferredoxin oxidoreductase family protein [Streptosporangiaceae bacterium]|nr:indolepyruvate ferredoxin oxidoreductase family protein [Streptosporangiaceae bacterium]
MTVTAAGFDLDAKYRVTEGGVLITGVQALARVLFDQIRADRRRGLNTAAFVSGYPGSPLGGFDQTLQRTGSLLGEHDVHWMPGVNEDLAATAVWGSQQDNLAPLRSHNGVIGMWYGKAPGVDRCGDVFRHANLHGIGTNGGVICAAGDDPASKSSTLPGASEVALYDAGMPVLVPGTPQEVLDLGRHGYELSRFTGCWTGLKMVTAVCDGFGSADVASERIVPQLPELSFDGQPWRFAQAPRFFLPVTIDLEAELYERRHEAARAYAARNSLNVAEVDPPDAWLTIVSSGRVYREVRQALAGLGLARDAEVAGAGIRLVRLGMIYPLEPGIVRAAARGVQEILVVEEKRPFVERFIREQLYESSERPRVTGKRDERDRPLVPVDGELSADRLRPVLARRLAQRLAGPQFAPLDGPARASSLPVISLETTRTAAFCSGCPHNRSTIAGAGSPVGGGVGCHAMVMWLDRGAVSYSQMGGEGAQWLGRAPFTAVPHYVQNVGDGTFFHSGSLAVRAAVAAGVTMTFKILYNGVVAMTGGQDPAGQLDVPRMCRALAAEGVARIIVVSDDPARYRSWAGLRSAAGLPAGTRAWGRDRLAEAERVLAGVPGVTVLVYDQACANELRRLRKRGRAPERAQRVVINEAVCEGCGDCGTKSNCLSVRPVETELGRKTQIDQASCNTDYSCLDGDCPSFVTVRAPSARAAGARPAPSAGAAGALELPGLAGELPEPASKAAIAEVGGYGIVATGIGGTGVVMLNQVLATAAFLDGLGVTGLDQTGLSQKAGPVVSHLRLWHGAAAPAPPADAVAGDGAGAAGEAAMAAAAGPRDAPASHPEAGNAVGEESADLLLALDLLVAAEPRHLARLSAARTVTVACTSVVPTAGMVRGSDPAPDASPILTALRERSRPGGLTTVDTEAVATALFGDAVAANVIALGAAYQAGAVPVAAASIERAIELNGVAVQRNKAAFRAGRLAVHDPAALPAARRAGELRRREDPRQLAAAGELAAARGLTGPAAGRAVRRAAELIDYQDARLAGRYLDLVGAAARADAARVAAGQAAGQDTAGQEAAELTEAVTDAFFHLLAYKDEYEVARLHLLPEFGAALAGAVPGGRGVRYQLHPPVLRALGLHSKIGIPAPLARPAFRALRGMRKVRGSRADVFGYTRVRRTERRLAAEYEAQMRPLLDRAATLPDAGHAAAVELARLPLGIRGYEEIKLAAVARYEADRARLRAGLGSPR